MVDFNVELKEQTGMPEGLFVSVRVGDAQKLSKLCPQRKYCFPKCDEGQRVRTLGKLDVYQKLGSCIFDADAKNLGVRQVVVNCKETGHGEITFGVGVENRGAPDAPKVPASPVDKAVDPDEVAKLQKQEMKQKNAKAYLTSHGVELRLSEAMQEVLKHRPDNPVQFIAQRLLEVCAVTGGAAVGTAPPQAEKSDMMGTEAVKKAAGKTLVDACQDGRLETAVASITGEKPVKAVAPAVSSTACVMEVEELRELGSHDGSSEKNLSAKALKSANVVEVEDLRKLAGGTGGSAMAGGDAVNVEPLRKKATESLVKASQDGTLAQALANRMAVDKVNVDKLRATVMRNFTESSQNGILEAALKKHGNLTGGSVDVEALRKVASHNLVEASTTGKLQEALERRR